MTTTRNRRCINAPAYYRGRPASMWYAAIDRRRPAAGRGEPGTRGPAGVDTAA